MQAQVWLESGLVCAGAVLEWALALYVITRGGWQRVAVLTTLAIVSLVVYQVGIGFSALATSVAGAATWVRVTWPGPALLPALWLLVTASLAREEGPERALPLLRRLYTTAAIGAVGLGLFFASSAATDLVRRWGPLARADGLEVTSVTGPLYPLYFAYVAVCALWAMANAFTLWRASAPGTPLRARWGALCVTAVLFVLGGLYLGVAASDLSWRGTPGDALLIVGMLVMGWSVARYGALVAGEVVASDFVAYALSMVAVVLTYAAALWILAPHDLFWLERGLLLLLLAMATHVLVPRQSLWVERRLYGPVAGTLRDQLRLLSARVVRQPDPISALVEVRESVADLVRQQGAAAPPAEPVGIKETQDAGPAQGGTAGAEATAPPELRVLVEGALRRLNDLPTLAQHPLLERLAPLEDVATGTGSARTVLERATRLRDALVQAIARLRPPGARPNPGPHGGSGGWLHFLVLHEAYVEGRPNKEVMQRYHLSEGTFHRARRRAIDALALDLHQRLPA